MENSEIQTVALATNSVYQEYTSTDTFYTYKCSAPGASNPSSTDRVWQILRVTIADGTEVFMQDLDDATACDVNNNQRLYNGMYDTIVLYLDSLTPCTTTPVGRGATLVTNGDFSSDSDWTKGTDWVISGGVATCNASSDASKLTSSAGVLTDTVEYRITYDVTAYTSGGVRFVDDATLEGVTRKAVGTYTEVVTATATGDISFESVESFVGSIDNVVIQEVSADTAVNGSFSTDTNWDKSADWTISGGLAVCAATGDASQLSTAVGLLTDTVEYRITYTILNYVSGGIKFVDDATLEGIVRKTNGTFTEIVTATATGDLHFESHGAFVGNIDNVIVEPIAADSAVNGTFAADTDWDKVSGFTIAGGLAVCSTSSDGIALVTATDDITVGDQYVIMYDIDNYVSGAIRFEGGGVVGATQSADDTEINEMFTALETGKISLVTVGSFVGDLDNVILRKLT